MKTNNKFIMCLFALSLLIIPNTKQSNVQANQKSEDIVLNQLGNDFQMSFVNLTSSFTKDDIKLNTQITKGIFSNFEIDNGEIIKNDISNDGLSSVMTLKLLDEFASVTVTSSFMEQELTRTVFFNVVGDLVYTSEVSQDAAFFNALENQELPIETLKIKKQEIISENIETDIKFSFTTEEEISLNLTLNWEDDSLVVHTLNYTKIQLISIVGDITTVESEMFTDNEGKCSALFTKKDEAKYFARITTEGELTKVVDINNLPYLYDYELPEQIDVGTQLDVSHTFTMDHELGQAMQLSQTAIYSARHAKMQLNVANLVPCTIHYGNSGAYYTSNNIYIKQTVGSATRPSAYADWDVMGHEYSHHIQKCQTAISQNTGGTHYVGVNHPDYLYGTGNYTLESAKSAGLRLTWAEGWATYNSIIMQDYFGAELSNIKFVQDAKYTAANGVNYNLLGYGYTTKTYGEGDEIATSQLLYKLADVRTDSYESFGIGELTQWEMVKDCKPIRLTDYINYCYTSGINKNALGKFIEQYNIAPKNLQLMNGTNKTFTWEKGGGSVNFSNDTFKLLFLNDMGETIFETNEIKGTSYTLSFDQLTSLINQHGHYYYAYVIGSAKNYFETGPYYSQEYRFDIPTSNDLIKYMDIVNTDYGFQQEYVMTEVAKELTIGDKIVSTKRLRTGCISKDFIVMSPRRVGAGTAYLEYTFDTLIHEVSVDLSLWSATELLRPSDCTASFQYKSVETGEWITLVDLLNDITLPTDKLVPINYTFVLNEPALEIRFHSTAPQIGATNNTGRLCIGNMSLMTAKPIA